ncbi:MAG TPA: efflux RND transporter periplasmic adaptor subunit [Accumulibacter sp.]|nr:efflux RND transporter periplasmic adaptor subunit [Accumulibacter sp.]HMW16713.1 efflux RND transporter periplasmic adaptor subunit [Accumulibacter sp.]HMY06884.1 efflux RND transporter periplasmic adaptor subunit [Accumulibacter sp.]HNC18157.1 efflux RND transporter periplasmic adaptor subunit [Accumulibacter sp.]HND79766.1 efflux RND transporter periplasmic adaptor subunit [Accumulibacter sp.]
MNAASLTTVALIVAVLAAASGYWLGKKQGTAAETAAAAGSPPEQERKILYYRNPMGLPDTSPTPKKDSMGMDYLPVYADEKGDQGGQGEDSLSARSIRIAAGKIQQLGVRSEAAAWRTLDRQIHAVGRVEADERRMYTISPKFDGYVDRLHVNVSGQPVAKGQALFEVYSPELVSAQREYLLAVRGVERLKAGSGDRHQGHDDHEIPDSPDGQANMRQLAAASLARLRNWDISDEQLSALKRSGEARRTLTFRSPVTGLVTEKKAVQGMRFSAGESLYQVTDLTKVWVLADVFEQDLGLVKAGAQARVRVDAYPEKSFVGRVETVYPTLNPQTRTVAVRIELDNPGRLLKPGMFTRVDLPAAAKDRLLTVPNSAVLDSGKRRIVLVDVGEGRFTPREVRLGARDDEHVAVIEGLHPGERVVVAANFLIDSESNLRAALDGFGDPAADRTKSTTKTVTDQATTDKAATAGVAHRATGTIDQFDAKAATLLISHGPVASLNWPAMTMTFKAANASLLGDLQAGAAIDFEFEFVERAPGEWVITALSRAAQSPAPVPAGPPLGSHSGSHSVPQADAHAGHHAGTHAGH